MLRRRIRAITRLSCRHTVRACTRSSRQHQSWEKIAASAASQATIVARMTFYSSLSSENRSASCQTLRQSSTLSARRQLNRFGYPRTPELTGPTKRRKSYQTSVARTSKSSNCNRSTPKVALGRSLAGSTEPMQPLPTWVEPARIGRDSRGTLSP